jgi:hypothetical protein
MRVGLPTQRTCSTAGPLCIIHSPFLYVRAEASHRSASPYHSAYAGRRVRPMAGYPYQREGRRNELRKRQSPRRAGAVWCWHGVRCGAVGSSPGKPTAPVRRPPGSAACLPAGPAEPRSGVATGRRACGMPPGRGRTRSGPCTPRCGRTCSARRARSSSRPPGARTAPAPRWLCPTRPVVVTRGAARPPDGPRSGRGGLAGSRRPSRSGSCHAVDRGSSILRPGSRCTKK